MAAPPPHQSLEPFAVGVVVAGTLIGPEAAQYIAAYLLILMGWFAGLLWGLWRRPPDAKMPIWAFTLCTCLVSVGGTVLLAQSIADHVSGVAATSLLLPVSFLFPAFFDKWGDVLAWAWGKWESIRGGNQGAKS